MSTIRRENEVRRRLRAPSCGLPSPFSRSPGAPSLWTEQPSPQHVQVRQRKGGEQPRGVLGQSAVAHLGKTPQALDHMKGMLTACPGAGTDAVDELLMITQRLRAGATTIDPIADAAGFGALTMKLAPVRLIPEQLLLLAMQQMRQLADVRLIGRRGGQAMDYAAPVGAHMRLHPEMPVLALLGLVHLRIARLLGVLGRGGRLDNRGIDNRAGLQQQALVVQQRADLG